MSLKTSLLSAAGGVPTDPFFKNTALLLHGDGTSGAQNNTFLDSSSNNFTITRNGNATQGPFSPYGDRWSNYFNGTTDYLSTPVTASGPLDLGASNWTIECWVNIQSFIAGTENDILTFSNNAGQPYVQIGLTRTTFNFFAEEAGQSAGFWSLNSGTSPKLGVWTHLAVVRNGSGTGNITIYVDGVSKGSTTYASAMQSLAVCSIGALKYNGGYRNFLNGNVSNLRITKGVALYTRSFTPSATPLTSVSGTSLLTCQSNRFRDASSNNFALTVTGTPRVTRFSPFTPTAAYNPATDGGSGYFDGTGDYLTGPSNAAFAMGSGDFTIDGFYYDTQAPAAWRTIISLFDSTAAGKEIRVSYTIGAVWGYVIPNNTNNGDVYVTASSTPSRNQWVHFALVRSGTTVTLYVNGQSVASTTGVSFNHTSTNLLVGSNPYAADPKWYGYIANLRVVKGLAVYTGAFTPPTAPIATSGAASASAYPSTTNVNTTFSSSSCSLLLNFTNAGIYDSTAQNDVETAGNAQVSTSVKLLGTGSLSFDGTGDWLPIADQPHLRLGTADFTIEGFVRLNSLGVARGIVGKGTSTAGWLVSINASNQLVFTYGTTTVTGTTALAANTWYYFAVVRSGSATGNVKLYLGTTGTTSLEATSAAAVTTSFTETNILYVGCDRTATSPMNGYIDELRLTIGVARYLSAPTVPEILPDL